VKPLLPATVVELSVNGTVLLSEDVRGLSEVHVEQRLSLPAQCELTFVTLRGDGTLPLVVGDSLTVTPVGSAVALFSGDVTALHYSYESMRGRVLRVRAYDRLHRLRKRQPVRAHVEVTAAALAYELAADLAVAVTVHAEGPPWRRLLQYRHNDLELLAEVSERCGQYFALHDGTLHLFSLEGIGEPVELRLGEGLIEASCEVNGDPACRSVAAVGWDPHRVEQHQGRAERARSGRTASASAGPEAFGTDGAVNLMGVVVHDARQAEALAQGALDRRIAGEVALGGVADGDPALHPGARVSIAGLDPEHDGTYVLTAVTHHLDAQRGFTSRFTSEPPVPRPRMHGTGAALGVVCRIDDPEKIGRVQVALPGLGGLESDWLEVLSVGAGAGKGLMALPDVGDQVLVLAIDDDPGRGVVIGGLYGAGGWPDNGIESDAVRRFTLKTPGGQRVVLDDHGELMRLENKHGSFVELSPGQVKLHAEGTGLTIEAPGHPLVIRAKSVDFEEA
jgi:phage baseplate assembly protein gpV/phage protein D